jgi:hypothetical protein
MPLSTHVFCFLFRLPMHAKLVYEEGDHVSSSSEGDGSPRAGA